MIICQLKSALLTIARLASTLFGGPSQPEPTDSRGGILKAQQMANERSGVVNPNQYTNHAVGFADEAPRLC